MGSHDLQRVGFSRNAKLCWMAVLQLLLVAAATLSHDSHLTASSPLLQASAWSAALNLRLDSSPSFCSCSPVSQRQHHEPFTYCYWACETHLVVGNQMSVLQLLGKRFKACTVSLITGEEYLEGATIMTHSYAAAYNENQRCLRLSRRRGILILTA
jgi:hypothetical protein